MSTRRATMGEGSQWRSGVAHARSRPVSHRARRRRLVAAMGAAGVLAVVALALYPTVHHAFEEITLPLRHEDIIRQQAARKHLDPALIAAVIYAESKFDARDSATGAKGLMQLQPATARFIAHRSGGTEFQIADLAEPQVNIAYGSYYLRYLLERYDGNATLAVAAYNGGETNVDRWIGDAGRGRAGFRTQDIRFAETRAYVERVFKARQDYRATYGSQLGL